MRKVTIVLSCAILFVVFSIPAYAADESCDACDIPQLIEQLRNEETRGDAFGELVGYGCDAIPAFAGVLGGEDIIVMIVVCKIIQTIGPEAIDAIPALIAVLDNDDPELRKQAIIALGRIGVAAWGVIPELKNIAAWDNAGFVRDAAFSALFDITGEWFNINEYLGYIDDIAGDIADVADDIADTFLSFSWW